MLKSNIFINYNYSPYVVLQFFSTILYKSYISLIFLSYKLKSETRNALPTTTLNEFPLILVCVYHHGLFRRVRLMQR